MSDWIKFWDSSPSIYVNARHKDVHYRDVARAIADMMDRPIRVLDYGSGEAIHADLAAAKAEHLTLSDAAPSARAAMAKRFADNPKIRVLAPDEVESLPDQSFDLIVANSVVQYLSGPELDRLLALWCRLLRPDGRLVVADVIPPEVGPLSDALALIRYAAQNRFLVAALIGLARTAISPYRKLRAKLGVSRYAEQDFRQRLETAGFSAERLTRNIEHNPARMTFLARPASPRTAGAPTADGTQPDDAARPASPRTAGAPGRTADKRA